MSTEPHGRQEQPSTYFVQDRHSKAERDRVTVQDRMLTEGMGGALPEQPDPTLFSRVLDVGCGTGCWLIEAAKTYPGMTKLVGIDISTRMVEYGRQLAEEQGVSDRVEFQVMDAIRTLGFPSASFDLINQRLGWSYLRTWEWPDLLQEYQRVARPGGVIRITETAAFGETSSPALNQLYDIARDAFFHSGHLFSNNPHGVTSKLAEILHQQGIQNVQTREVHVEMGSAMTDAGKEDIKLFFQTAVPFLQKWTRVPKNYDQLRQKAQEEMEQPSFTAKWEIITFWGTNPYRQKTLP